MSLSKLRAAIAAGQEIVLADPIKLGDESFAADSKTAFEAQDPEPWSVDLKSIVHAWLSRKQSLADYIAGCEEAGVKNLKFAERADLLAWLEGASNESEYIQETDAGTSTLKRDLDEIYKPIYSREKVLVDHNTVLHGVKRIDFSSASKLCHRLIMAEYRRNQKFSTSGSASGSSSSSSKAKPKEPIIILSPSPSSLINMANIKSFLETGTFEPLTRSASTEPFTTVHRESPALGKVRFFVVDNVEKFKPEYWERVVAVFVTGQPWQLKQYKWSDPNQLFSHVTGLSVSYKGDPIPPTLKSWNVTLEEIERSKRFRDHEVVERIWEKLEKQMLGRGWGKK